MLLYSRSADSCVFFFSSFHIIVSARADLKTEISCVDATRVYIIGHIERYICTTIFVCGVDMTHFPMCSKQYDNNVGEFINVYILYDVQKY